MLASPRGTFAVSDAVELAVVTRGGFIESRHSGTAFVLSAEGDAAVELGDPSSTILTRSALKPLQSLAMHTAGLNLKNNAERALSLASHTGSLEHSRIVGRMLEAAGLNTSHLGCPESMPLDRETRYAMIREGMGPQRVTHGCSGKHAAMLATCVTNGWPIESYLDLKHPLQEHITETVTRFSGERPAPITVDGCGAPTYGLSVRGLAQAIRRMASSTGDSPFPVNRIAHGLIHAAKKHPHLVEGRATGDAAAMQYAGVFAKYGAEGISVMAAPDGTTAVVKILDGSLRAARIVALSLLAYTGAISKGQFTDVIRYLDLSVSGGGKKVGDIRVSIPSLS